MPVDKPKEWWVKRAREEGDALIAAGTPEPASKLEVDQQLGRLSDYLHSQYVERRNMGDDSAGFFDEWEIALVRLRAALDKAQRERDAGVYADIRVERARQNEQWGGPEHDDRNIISDWRAYRQKFERRASAEVTGADRVIRRDALVKIAALTVAQIESLDRASQSTSGVKE